MNDEILNLKKENEILKQNAIHNDIVVDNVNWENCLYKKRIRDLKKMKEIQGTNGNYNYDSYNLGLYNGLEFALSIMNGREPIYIDGKKISFIGEDK